ncbi:MAG: response regulator transcription factor [Desulfobulbaceae bacterium]|nr:response regulator transcription factor [Desulfobulbaceae bacterium]HIJ90166.1 response regulator transcription factor [Deltaproteobacteria bacterium]
MNTERIRILVVDDHPVLLSGLSLLLNAEPDMEVAGTADSGPKALALAKELQPDIVLLDISLPGISGLLLLPEILRQVPKTRVLMLTMHEDYQYVKEAVAKGAKGFMLKKCLDVDLFYAIRAVMRGQMYIHPAMMPDILAGQDKGSATPEELLWLLLSNREQQVMLAVAMGFTSREIAEQHFLSEKTVATYRSRAMAKLGLETRAELVEFVSRQKRPEK